MASFADDDFYDPHEDDYADEEEEMSPEDKAAMAKGTEEVKKALGPDASKLSVTQIQEALWHYYYDVEKSVGYLQKTFISPTPKPTPKKAPEGEFFAHFPSSTAALEDGTGADYEGSQRRAIQTMLATLSPRPARPLLETPSLPMDTFFADMPWLQTNADRRSTFTAPWTPPGGLLGGSEGAPKMSKLQALAAARKKKTEQKKEQDKELQAEKGLKDLSISSKEPAEQTAPAKSAPSASAAVPTPMRKQSEPQTDVPDTTDGFPADNEDYAMHGVEVPVGGTTQRSAPSAFARTLIGSAPGGTQTQRQDTFAMSYTSSSSYLASAFSEPSPDDIVLAAQAKGSNFARAK